MAAVRAVDRVVGWSAPRTEPTAPPSWPMLECAGPWISPVAGQLEDVLLEGPDQHQLAEHACVSRSGSAASQSASVTTSSTQGDGRVQGRALRHRASLLGSVAVTTMPHDWIQSSRPAMLDTTDLLMVFTALDPIDRDREDAMATARAAPAVDHVGFTVPDLEEAHRVPRRRARLRVPLLARAVRARGRRLDGRAPERASRAPVMRRNRFFRCGDQAIFEVFHYEAPDQSRRYRRATATSAATTSRSTSTTSTPRSPTCAAAGVRVLGEPTASTRAARGPALGLLPRALGDAVRAGQLPGRQGVRPRNPRGAVAMTGRTHAHRRRRGQRSASRRLPPRARSSAATSRPGERIRQEEVAERLGASRLPVREALRMLEAEGLTEHEPNKGARVPRLDHARGRRHLPDARAPRAARARREPAAPDRRATTPGWRTSRPDRGQRRPRPVPRARPRVPPAHLHRLPDRAR